MMHFVKYVASFVLLTIFYIGSLVLAFAGLQVSLEDTAIIAGQPVVVHAQVSNAKGDVDYDWYIDGVPLAGVSTQGLDLGWEVYTELFPEDNDTDVTRLITLEATDALGTSSDTATLSIVYNNTQENVCGDGIRAYKQGEECDDGNTISGDGCDATCWCEGMCETLLMTKA